MLRRESSVVRNRVSAPTSFDARTPCRQHVRHASKGSHRAPGAYCFAGVETKAGVMQRT